MGLIDIDHPATGIPGELYGRYLIPAQSQGHLLAADDAGFSAALEMIEHLATVEYYGHTETKFWHPSPELLSSEDLDLERSREWAHGIASCLGGKASGEDVHTHRASCDWLYYRAADGSFAILESEEVVDLLELLQVLPSEEIAGIDGFLYTGNHFNHFVPASTLEVADAIFGQSGALSRSKNPASLVAIIPLENSVLLAHRHRVVMLRCDSGVSGFTRERSLVLERNRLEQGRLFPPTEFIWADDIDGGRFERLVYDLLECEPGVRYVRAVGGSREGDGGRDLLLDWATPPGPGERVGDNDPLVREKRVIVQCKARKRSVGRAELDSGIMDTLFMYHGEGYFLAVSSQPTAAVIDLLDEIGRRGHYFTGWWGRTEIEQRLRRQPQVLKRYPDIVRPGPK